MKILIIINSLTVGGAEKQAVFDANKFHQHGYDVTIAFHQDGELKMLLNPEIRIRKIRNKNIIMASAGLFFHFLFKKYDIIHAHMYWAEKISILSLGFVRQKVIFNEHGIGLWRKWYHIAILRLISKKASIIVNSCNKSLVQRTQVENLQEEKNLVVYNSYNDLNKNESTKLFPEAKDKKFNIGFVGRVELVKRLNILVEIGKELKKRKVDFYIYIVGDGNEKPALENMVKESGLEENFKFTGFQEDPARYLRIFDIFILPSKIEAFSLALLEAGSMGLPLLAFDVGGNSEIIKDKYNGFLIKENDISSLINQIETLYSDRDLLKKMSENSRYFITTEFSIDKRIKKLEELYQEKK